MRRGWPIVLAIVVTLLLVGVGVGAYNAGVNAGIEQAADSSQIVQVVGYGWHHGFFPFGLFLFPLFLFGLFFLIGGAFRRGRWGGGPGHHHGPWSSEEGRARFEERANEWHARQHEQGSSSEAVARRQQGSTSPDPGGGAATTA
jgi:hypothetical protein